MATSMKLLRCSLENIEKLFVSTAQRRCLTSSATLSTLPNSPLQNKTGKDKHKNQEHDVCQRKLLFSYPVHRCSNPRNSQPYCTDTTILLRPFKFPIFSRWHLSFKGDYSAGKVVSSPAPPVVDDTDEPDILYSKLILEVKGHDPQVLQSYERFISSSAQHLGVNLFKVTTPKMDVFRQSVLASVHIFKKHQVQYEERTYYKVFEFHHVTGSTADTFLEYSQRNLPEGVAMKVTKHQVLPIPGHLKPPKKAQQIDS